MWVYCPALHLPEWMEMTEQVDWRVKQLSQVACFVEDLRCWGAWHLRLKGKDIIPSTACKREVWKEEALDDLSSKSERGPLSIRRTLQMLQRWHWGHFWVVGWSVYGLFWLCRYHLNLNWTAEWSSLTRRVRHQIPWALWRPCALAPWWCTCTLSTPSRCPCSGNLQACTKTTANLTLMLTMMRVREMMLV